MLGLAIICFALTVCFLLFIMSDSVPLLSSSSVTSKRRCSSCPSSYCFQFIHSKGALLVLFWDLMISISQNLFLFVAFSFFALANYFYITTLVVSLFYFLAGYFGDFLVSRYKVVLAGSYVAFILLIFFVTIFMLLPTYTYLLLVFCISLLITIVIVRVNLLPFNIDQLIGSSSGELTTIIHWHNIGPVIVNAIYIFDIGKIPLLITSTACVAAVLVSHSLFNRYLETTPVNTVNPVKLIVRVLCYARKHKYPENRSALTYWEEEAPSRLDLGKDKYGGPFTEEEVEDLKTILRLIPLVFVCALASGFYGEYTAGPRHKHYGCTGPGKILGLSLPVTYIFIIFAYQFLIYPCFHKYIPSMLKRIGTGLVLTVLFNVLYTGLAVFGNYHFGHIFHCFTSFDEHSSTIHHKWMLFDNVIDAVIWYIYNVVLVEFILAQCPKSIRGSVIGLWFCLWNLRSYIQFISFLPFLHYMGEEVPLGRGFYYLLTQAIVCLFLFLIYIFLAKRYKLRVREVEINIHQIAEDHTINDIEQEEEYWRRNPIESSSQSTDMIISEYK